MASCSQKAILMVLGVFFLVAATTVTGQNPPNQPNCNVTTTESSVTTVSPGDATTEAGGAPAPAAAAGGGGGGGGGGTTVSSDGTTVSSENAAAGGGNSATTTVAPDSSAENAAAGGGNSATTTVAPDSSDSGGTTVAGDSSAGSSETTPANADSSSSEEADSTSSSSSSSDSSSSDSGSSSSGSQDSSSSSSQTSDSSSSGSSSSSTDGSASESSGSSSGGTASHPLITPIKISTVKVKVDETSIAGTGLLVQVTKYNVPSVTPYQDPTTTEYRKFSNAVSKLTTQLKESMGSQLTGSAALKNVVAVNATTVRGEYIIKASSEVSLDYSALNSLDQNDVFRMDELNYKMGLVPLASDNRWFTGDIRFHYATYKNTLNDPESEDFREFKHDFELNMREQLKFTCPHVRQAIILEFFEGSVKVRYGVETTENVTEDAINQLSNAVEKIENVGDLAVDPDSSSIAKADYINGIQNLDPVNKDALPSVESKLRDDEDIRKGDYSLTNAKEIDGNVQKRNFFLTVTIPSFVVVLIVIIIFLCCTTSDSFLCKICSNDTKSAA